MSMWHHDYPPGRGIYTGNFNKNLADGRGDTRSKCSTEFHTASNKQGGLPPTCMLSQSTERLKRILYGFDLIRGNDMHAKATTVTTSFRGISKAQIR